jgi:uncharacterized protein (TIGR00730 family)
MGTGDLKLMNRSLKEMRYAATVFSDYRRFRKVCVFGSARTPPSEAQYEVAEEFAREMVAQNYMVITGAGDGIMGAAQRGAGREHSFGLNIRLPFEQHANVIIEGDKKLINFNYFFTRKLNFVKETHAFALFPGGFGTMDEAFELLTLMQTGRSPICPVVLLEPEDGTYWDTWRSFVERELLARRLVDETDLALVCQCHTVDDAVREITRFYSRYHSMRYVGRRLVIRMRNDISDDHLAALNRDFADVVVDGEIERVTASDNERQDGDAPDLPRIAFRFDRWHFARLRALIDAINAQ